MYVCMYVCVYECVSMCVCECVLFGELGISTLESVLGEKEVSQ